MQKERVLQKLAESGEVNNFWAIENYILRLGAIIGELRREGYVFEGSFGKKLGKDRPLWRNFYYIQDRTKLNLIFKQ